MKSSRVAALCLLAASAYGAARQEISLAGPAWGLWYDRDASWQNDELFLPPVDLSRVPANPPTCGWGRLESLGQPVSVPGTVEEYLQTTAGPDGDLTGVSWWFRTIRIPEGAPRRLLLRFEAVRLRAEVYLNRKLVGYDLIGNSPFEVDLTSAARPGERALLAIRVTDPGGNFDWRDSASFAWGKYHIPASHGFGGITGAVRLVVCNPVYIDDLYVQNAPGITTANLEVAVRNTTPLPVRRALSVRVFEKNKPDVEVFHTAVADTVLAPGATTIPVKISAPQARAWSLDAPSLYVCEVTLRDRGQVLDSGRRVLGFRWFEPAGIGRDAVFRLNGKRIVLRTSISWGFWPINGIFPAPELAEKQIRDAKELGLNMLNFHRAIGQPVVLDLADELGLLYYEEPGGYRSGGADAFADAISREKLLRMVRRDRSHPSLVIYNMINESSPVSGATLENQRRDMADAHRLDPSRVITRTSAWAAGPDVEDSCKMHARPFDETIYMTGWYDYHHAGGPAVWNEALYRGPRDYYNRSENRREIVFWGEEGAISSPPRLAKIKETLDSLPRAGWDGAMYLDWFRAADSFLSRKNLRSAFPNVDAFTTALASVSYEHQGRKIETIRISDVADGYAINGWEAEIIENHSGIVDCFRNPKADPAIIAYYNQPLYITVKPRRQIVPASGSVVTDFYAINEKDLSGPHPLRIAIASPAGAPVFAREIPVELKGGEVYGQLIAEGVTLPVPSRPGLARIEAALLDPAGKQRAAGRDEVLAVKWGGSKLSGKGAVWEPSAQVRPFLENAKGLQVAPYDDNLGPLDWVVVAGSPASDDPVLIPSSALRNAALKTTLWQEQKPEVKVTRTDPAVNFSVAEGATPDPGIPTTQYFAVRWEGDLIPPATGQYGFSLRTSGPAHLILNGRQVISITESRGSLDAQGTTELEAGKPVRIEVEYHAQRSAGRCRLMWSVPGGRRPDPRKLIDRALRDGTSIVILERAGAWMQLLRESTKIAYNGSFKVGTAWLGGDHFVRDHPLFKDLPVNGAMDWPYQAVVRNGNDRYGLLLEGEELVAGAYHSYPMQLGTAVGVVPCGKGRIIVSTLDIADNLDGPEGAPDVARKLLCNFLEYAARK